MKRTSHSQKKFIVLHPIFTAIFPVLALYTANMDQVDSSVIWRPLFLSVILALVLWVFLFLILKDWTKSGLFTTWLLIFFFTYGHMRDVILNLLPELGHHRFVLPLWLFIVAAGCWWILRRKGKLQLLHQFLNGFSGAMILIQFFLIGQSQVVSLQVKQIQMGNIIPLTLPDKPPDIYYIILDGYARSDVLRGVYGFDNTPFLEQLREIGFFVANCSLANYSTTRWSLSSLLNMSYLKEYKNVDVIYPELIKHSKVRLSLENIGYKTVAFETGFGSLNLTDSDYYIKTSEKNIVNNFELVYLQSTLGKLLWDILFHFSTEKIPQLVWQPKAERDQLIIKNLEEIAELPSPKLVYSHLTFNHTPYLFTEHGVFEEPNFFINNGYAINQDWDKKAYITQIKYSNEHIIKVIREILAKSNGTPIIILQGDHGPFPPDPSSTQPDYIRMPILNAYLLPQKFKSRLYPEITPVNSFRLIFDALYKGKLGLIEDRSIYYDGKRYLDSWDSCR